MAVGDQPTSIVAGDFNGDGRLDLAVANANSDDVSLLLGKANRTFAAESRLNIRLAPASLAAGDFRSTLVAGDFNTDGQLDLAVVSSLDPDVAMALGNGDGTFQRRTLVLVDGQPQALVTGDFNGDGRLDFASVNGIAADASVRFGLGDGTFQADQRLVAGNEAPDWSRPISTATALRTWPPPTQATPRS